MKKDAAKLRNLVFAWFVIEIYVYLSRSFRPWAQRQNYDAFVKCSTFLYEFIRGKLKIEIIYSFVVKHTYIERLRGNTLLALTWNALKSAV
jgi:hypothetical protein